ncbi:MAG: tRNA uridine-5-carboxymethylaminomethyl(34) synthesis GTPase MnmE [Betaproteobacteria bacterium RIFCSPLOWO2_12_FULL_62_13]|nr:MAG: tRNA uridine-5-carboxymethylaminomethyl(34) synthesis GTPase MnmE [Betaproteobacteria bacterium RIFCSPLOWO2_12_FULL_62_13]
MASNDIIAALATAPGRSGIGIVRVSGPRLDCIIEPIVGKPLPPRRAVLAQFRDAQGAAIDQGVALYFPSPRSYTGEDVLELQGHGGPVVLQLLLKRCLELGARVAEPGEFTKRAFLNNKLDLAQAESVIDLIDAATAQAARGAVRSLSGEFSSEIQELRTKLITLRMLVEATLDFPDEEIDFLKQSDAKESLKELQTQVGAVLEASRQGSLLREGMHIVLAGRPNVGKSSLLNRMAGEEVAIVTDIPGTTRDAIRQVINLSGVPAHIIDTAGLRESEDPVEKIGIARTWAAIEKADLVLLLVDATRGEAGADREILARLPSALPCIRVMNKIDLMPRPAAVEQRDGAAVVWLSAKTGEGVDLLRATLLEAVGWHSTGEGLFLARARHVQALNRARGHLKQAGAFGCELELLAEELRLAQEALSSITGEFTPNDLLGEIFSHFCIGK